MRKAIVIGATSGIGRELTKQLSTQGHSVGITGRRVELLESLEQELPGPCFKMTMDLSIVPESVKSFKALIEQMEGVDLVVINSGYGKADGSYPLEDELNTIAVNVAGFTAIANSAYRYFSETGKGHIVGISSIAAARGGPVAAYFASKAYVTSYLEGLAARAFSEGKEITVTDIRPGFVDTAMGQGEGVFWRASVETAALQINRAIQKKRRVAYITKRWFIIWRIMKLLPFSVYRLSFKK